MRPSLARILAGASEQEAEAVWQALAQFVENGEDFLDGEAIPPAADVERIRTARALRDRLDAEMARIADEPFIPRG